MTRRHFVSGALAGIGAGLLPGRISAAPATPEQREAFQQLAGPLLRDWCDALVRLQINNASDPKQHGAFECPACKRLHGRCGDAVLPLLHQAEVTGESRYVDAAVKVYDWSHNMDNPDGSWNNDFPPVTWKGITVFSAIARAEALERHGHLLDKAVLAAWRERLRRAGDWIHQNINLETANINYGITAAYALSLLGRMFDDEAFRKRGAELGRGALKYFTPKDHFIAGEGRPADQRSPRGCLPIDLGYNVEESLPSLIQYARLTDDKEVLETVIASLKTHMEFMLPDGAWDNSAGTRSMKWSYWGSRTSDGCQAAFLALAPQLPALATAALRNTQLMRDCTHDGLLHGGPHYVSHGVPACVHHTFTHAKALAGALHELKHIAAWKPEAQLPRERASGVREFPEFGTWLVARGPWRATITSYDWFYKSPSGHPTGGALCLLHHRDQGTCLASTQAEYRLTEPNNQQPEPDAVFSPLTPRVEWKAPDGTRFATSHDATATVRVSDTPEAIVFEVDAKLVTPDGKPPTTGPLTLRLTHRITENAVTLSAQAPDALPDGVRFVLPVIASSRDTATLSDHQLKVVRRGGTLLVDSADALHREPSPRDRVFQTVPGLEAVPLHVELTAGRTVSITLTANPQRP